MIPGEIKGWRDYVGRKYRTARFGPVRFRDRDYGKAGRLQEPWVDGLLVNYYPSLPEVGHPLTQECLSMAFRLMADRVMNYAVARGLIYRSGRIVTTGFYRPPGMTWGLGKFRDLNGVIDTTDDWGHWNMAVDISLTQTAISFEPNLKRSSVYLCLKQAGLVTPFDCEPWHWRPKRTLRNKFIKEYPEYEMAD